MSLFLRLFVLQIALLCSVLVKAQSNEPANLKTNNELSEDQNSKKKQQLADEKGKERHMKIQTKKTRKRMKKSQKKARRFNEPKEEFFLFRLFRRH